MIAKKQKSKSNAERGNVELSACEVDGKHDEADMSCNLDQVDA